MPSQLLVGLRIVRDHFYMERFVGSDHILALVKSGSFSFESADGQSHTVNPLEGALFRKDVLYHRRVLSPVVMYFFRFRSDTPIFDSDKITFADQGRIASTISMLEQLDKGVFKDEFEHRQSLFSDIITQYVIENNCRQSLFSKDDPIERAIAEISGGLHKKICLARLGARSGLSYVQFLRRFKAATGMSPSDYIAALRLQKAKSMLTDSSLPIKEIAYICGFENEYYFSNFFKKHLCMSPSAFRNFSI